MLLIVLFFYFLLCGLMFVICVSFVGFVFDCLVLCLVGCLTGYGLLVHCLNVVFALRGFVACEVVWLVGYVRCSACLRVGCSV